mmetsp:Transcript_22611/g.50295  ORF Transcript_22611/g.50295 Transcript_22611/m.50295 type:complete len:202 (+) Transcript_22611:1360-1965(+)
MHVPNSARHPNRRRSRRRRHERVDLLAVLVPVAAQHDRAQLAIPRQPLEVVPIVVVEALPELAEEVTEEARVGHHCNALLRTGVQPLQELDGSITAVLVRLALVRIEDIFVVYHFREVEVGELLRNLPNRPPSIAAVVPPPFPALLPDQEPRGADLHTRGVFWGIHGRIDLIQEGRLSRRPGFSEYMKRRLTSPRQRTDDD